MGVARAGLKPTNFRCEAYLQRRLKRRRHQAALPQSREREPHWGHGHAGSDTQVYVPLGSGTVVSQGGVWGGIPEGQPGSLLQTVGAVCVRRNLRTLSAPIHVGAPSSPSSPGRPTYPLPPLRRMQESEGCSVSAVPGPQPGAPGPLVEAPPCTASTCYKGQEAREREGSTWDPMPPTLPHLSLSACQC